MTREEAKNYISEHAVEYFTRDKSRKGYICPICGSGSGSKGTGISENPRSKGHFTCWAGCFSNADIFEIIGKQYNLTDFNEIFNKACYEFRVSLDNTKMDSKTTDNDNKNFKEFYREAMKHLEETKYHRGISLETLKAHCVGYVHEWKHPKSPENVHTTPRLIIPDNWEGYLARDIRKNIPDNEKQYAKQRVGVVSIWNVRAIFESQQPIFVVEGEFDGLSILDVGGEAVALCSASNAQKLLDAVTTKKPKIGFILSLDNDNAGQKAREIISEGLKENEIPFCVHELPTEYKDANDFLIADRKGFEDWCNQGLSVFKEVIKAQDAEARQEFESESAFSDLGNFLQTLKKSREGQAIPTGFTQLDKILDGGLYPGLHFIGAISSLGKTSLTLQIADNIAKSGRGVLFFSLEMSRNELISKSLSRLTRQLCGEDTRLAKTTRGILRANFNPAEQKIFTQAVKEYSSYAGNLFISEGVGDIGVKEIKEKVERFLYFNEGVPPVVVIDYAQILAPVSERFSDKQNTDKNVLELKRLSRDYQIPVFAISSFNRENYMEPVNMACFKESGAVEYSSDVLIGLQYTDWDYQSGEKELDRKRRLHERLDIISALSKQGMPIEIECKILKQRNATKGKVKLNFYPMFNLFEGAE